jgi:hypothetical protein
MHLAITKDIVNDTASLHTGNNMFHKDTDARNERVLGLLFGTACLLSWFFLQLIGRDMVRFTSLAARILQEDTPRRKRLVFFITHALVMEASSKGVTEVADKTRFTIDDEVVLPGMVFFSRAAK